MGGEGSTLPLQTFVLYACFSQYHPFNKKWNKNVRYYARHAYNTSMAARNSINDESASEAGTGNVALRREVERVMSERGWSLQQAEVATGIPATTINRMRKGLAVKTPTVIRFGIAVGEGRERWAMVALGVAPPGSLGGEGAPVREITYTPDEDSIPVPEGYHDLDTASRLMVRHAAEEAFRALVAAMRASRQLSPGTVGFGADRYQQSVTNSRDASSGETINENTETETHGPTDAAP
jgi:hypothetical protein